MTWSWSFFLLSFQVCWLFPLSDNFFFRSVGQLYQLLYFYTTHLKAQIFCTYGCKIAEYIDGFRKWEKPTSNQQFYCSTWNFVLFCLVWFVCVLRKSFTHRRNETYVFRCCIVVFFSLFVCIVELARIGDTFCIHKRLDSIRMKHMKMKDLSLLQHYSAISNHPE